MNSYMLKNQLFHSRKVGESSDGSIFDLLGKVGDPRPGRGYLYFAQDDDGRVYSYSEIPVRPKKSKKWKGKGKTMATRIKTLIKDSKESVIVKKNGKFEIFNTVLGQSKTFEEQKEEVTEVAKGVDVKSTSLTERYPQRGFSELPNDYGIASAYTERVSSARDRNINFELNFDQYKVFFLIDKCELSGNTLGHYSRPTGMDQFSMDRIDPAKGYVMGNIMIIAADLNTAKSDLDKFMMADIPDEYKIEIMNRATHALRLRNK